MEVQVDVVPTTVGEASPAEEAAQVAEAVADAMGPEASSAVVEAALEAGEAKGQAEGLEARIDDLRAALEAHAAGDQAEVAQLKEKITMLEAAMVLRAAEAEGEEETPDVVEVIGNETAGAEGETAEPPTLPTSPEADTTPWYSRWRKRYL